jgi:hypothetical protein
MPNYRFHWLNAEGVERADCLMLAANDAEAFQIASGLLEDSKHPIMEVWRQSNRVHRLTRGALAAPISN